MQTFKVSDVQITKKTMPTIAIAKMMAERIEGTPEATGADASSLVQEMPLHGFISAAHAAFQHHYPFVFSPDAVWLCIAQGFAQHVNNNAEALRSKFVRHEGKVPLRVQRDGFVKGSASNDWPGVFAEFSGQIAEHIGKQRDLVVCDFSTTTPLTRAVSEITLLDAMQSYFEYHTYTMCGIPEIALLGSVDDWRSIRFRAAVLAEYDLGWWAQALLPVLDQFVNAANGSIDKRFWQSFYKWESESGGASITGWINTFFPYLKEYRSASITRRNDGSGRRNGVGASSYPSGLSRAPFTWHYFDTNFAMAFVGGFTGAAQEPDGGVRPSIGWAVTDLGKENT